MSHADFVLYVLASGAIGLSPSLQVSLQILIVVLGVPASLYYCIMAYGKVREGWDKNPEFWKRFMLEALLPLGLCVQWIGMFSRDAFLSLCSFPLLIIWTSWAMSLPLPTPPRRKDLLSMRVAPLLIMTGTVLAISITLCLQILAATKTLAIHAGRQAEAVQLLTDQTIELARQVERQERQIEGLTAMSEGTKTGQLQDESTDSEP